MSDFYFCGITFLGFESPIALNPILEEVQLGTQKN